MEFCFIINQYNRKLFPKIHPLHSIQKQIAQASVEGNVSIHHDFNAFTRFKSGRKGEKFREVQLPFPAGSFPSPGEEASTGGRGDGRWYC